MTRTGRLLAVFPVLAVITLAPAVAEAQHYRHGPRGYYGGGYGHRGIGPGALVGGAILGLGLGAVIASTPRYYSPPPVYYAPPPYYPPPYYAAPAYPPGYYAPGYYPPTYYPRY